MTSRLDRIFLTILSLLLFAGLLVSILSFVNACNSACQEAHKWTFLGLPVEIVGIPYFVATLTCYLLAFKNLSWTTLGSFFLAAGIGAEAWLVYLQHAVIGVYCPLCITIAFMVVLAAGIHLLYFIVSPKKQGHSMFMRISGLSASALVGFFTMFFLLVKIDPMMAVEKQVQENIVLGNPNGKVEIYIFTDWNCPACRRIEPMLERVVAKIQDRARIIFIDHALSPESLNYTPFNLSFLINNKDQYLAIRGKLEALAEKDKDPSAKEVNEALSSLGVKYQPLNYSEVALGIRYFKKQSETFGVKSTPTVVIVDKKSSETKKLVGTSEITEEALLQSVEGK